MSQASYPLCTMPSLTGCGADRNWIEIVFRSLGIIPYANKHLRRYAMHLRKFSTEEALIWTMFGAFRKLIKLSIIEFRSRFANSWGLTVKHPCASLNKSNFEAEWSYKCKHSLSVVIRLGTHLCSCAATPLCHLLCTSLFEPFELFLGTCSSDSHLSVSPNRSAVRPADPGLRMPASSWRW
jgi:hypothetical protein